MRNRDIRYQHGFGTELHGFLPEFNRAPNARSIMSNAIPDTNAERPKNPPTASGIPRPRQRQPIAS